MNIKRFSQFCTVGICNTGIHLATAWQCVSICLMPPIAANVTAFFIANFMSFIANTKLTFDADFNLTDYPRFLMISLVGLGISSIMVLAFGALGLHYLLAIGCASAMSAAIGFLLNSRYVFKST